MQFKIGDFVRLDFPTMKVIGIEGEEVRVTTLEGREMVAKTLPAACLTKVHPDPFIPTGEPKWIGEDDTSARDAASHQFAEAFDKLKAAAQDDLDKRLAPVEAA